MGGFFTLLLKMSLTASFVIAAVFLVRLLLARAPRRYSYALWLIVFVRLICPVAIETPFGAVPDPDRIIEAWRTAGQQTRSPEHPVDGEWMPDGEMRDAEHFADEKEEFGVPEAADISIRGSEEWELSPDAPSDAAEMSKDTGFGLNVWRISEAAWNIVSLCWLCGCLIFLGYGITEYFRLTYRLHRKRRQFIFMEKNKVGKETEASAILRRRRARILEDAGIGAPFTLGIFRPVICLPEGLLPFQREMVLAHECMHIRRQDNLLKLAAYAVRCMYWFHPLVWIAFRYFEEDMETSCDEAVLRRLGYERRKDYAKTLLALSEHRPQAAVFYPVSFGRKNSKARIRHVLTLKKTRRWAALASAAVVAAAAALLVVDHKPVQETHNAGDLPAEAERQKEDQEALLNAVEELEAQMREQEEFLVRQAESEARMKERESLEAQQSERTMLLMSAMIETGEIAEGEIRLTDSINEELTNMMDQVHPVIHADGACALLCNPLTGFEENGVTVEYAFPIRGVEDGSVILTAEYGCRVHPVTGEVIYHSGLDFAAEKGTPVNAAADGCVYRTGFDEENGNYVILIHENSELTYYAHCENVEVQAGDIVVCGQQIAAVGSDENGTGTRLHFAVSGQGRFLAPQMAGAHAF